MSNSVDPDETAHYEPSHLDLSCLLQKPTFIACGSEKIKSRPYSECAKTVFFKNNCIVKRQNILCFVSLLQIFFMLRMLRTRVMCVMSSVTTLEL